MPILLNLDIEHINHACFRIKANGKIIYLDPFKTPDALHDADVIFISHEHFDHCSIEDIRKIIKPETIIVCPPDCQSKFSGMHLRQVVLVKPFDHKTVEGIGVETIPAYNTNKKFHPRQNDWVGYVLTINGTRVYHCGDTDAIPEMKELKNIDIALMAVSGTYVMTAPEAATATNWFMPKVAVPMHYASIVGTKEDAETFKKMVKGKVEIF